jgi:hypothetical protein
VGDLSSSVSASHQGVEEGTHKKQALAWSRWQLWLRSVELFDDEYLEAFQPRTRTRLLGGFAAAVRAARFSGPAFVQLAAGSVADAVNYVAATFMEAGLPDPRQSVTGTSYRCLQRQYKSYKNQDRDLKHQKAITASTLLDMERQARFCRSPPVRLGSQPSSPSAPSFLGYGPASTPT